ncbi:hypothetical protein ACFQDP_03370 [Methylorubrum zatmanii]|uniref:Uncharacterized protein n=1 Tax=Methylorubrum zatmanii TaxID=29429 RepID=A0ABW1WMW1_9HYPH
MRGQDHAMQDRGASLRQPSPAAPRQDRDAADDHGLAQEAHALISLFLDIEDVQARRRCLDYVRREAEAAVSGKA